MSRDVAAIFAVLALAAGIGGGIVAQDAGASEEITETWRASPHADDAAEAFTHWNEEGEIPGECAVCHSTPGFLSYLESERGSAGMIDHPVAIGTTVTCDVCHAPAADGLGEVIFPSSATVALDDGSAVCAVCHQGRQWGGAVVAAVAGLEEDVVSPDLGFVNVHYSAAASTLMGHEVRTGYEYEGMDYAGRFGHVSGMSVCTDCHRPHTTEVALESCSTCHAGIEDFRDIRATRIDVDGDGDTAEGIGRAIADLHGRLGDAIRSYAAEVADAPIAYAPGSYPYFFVDTDGDGTVGAEEAAFPNRYRSWTPRLLKAAYNYQFVAKDGGAFAHNPRYAIQLLVDSLSDLADATDAVDRSGLSRP